MSEHIPSVTINKPSEEIVRQALKELSITDSRGRSILLRKPGVLAQYRLVEVVGPDTAKNEVYMQMVLPVTWVSSIDGDTVPFPSRKSELEALIQRLDDDGIEAVIKAVQTAFGAQNPQAQVDAVKN